MNGFRLPRTLLACLWIAALGTATLGCSKKITRVDSSYTVPEGRFTPDARLILYPDIEMLVPEFLDKAPPGPDVGDSLLGYFSVRRTGPGVFHGMVLDGTSATGYQMLRRESGGGYLPLKDFALQPSVRWLESHWEVYSFEDRAPSQFSPPTYLGRGLASGVVTPTSPLTNPAQMSAVPTTPMSFTLVKDFSTTTGYSPLPLKIQVSGAAMAPIRFSGDQLPADSLFRISWGAVAGAAGYWIQVFQYQGAATDEVVLNGLPSPLATGLVVDRRVVYVAAPDTLYKIGTTAAQTFADKQMLVAGSYFVRIVAVNASGRMIGFSYGNAEVATGSTSYVVFPLGGFVVQPKRPDPGSTRAESVTRNALSASSPVFNRFVRAR